MTESTDDNPKLSLGRFSLLSLLLLTTTIACAAGWISALRQTELARVEALALRREVETYRDRLAHLDVIDATKVHAIGLNDSGWKMFFPPGRYVVHCYDGPYEGDDLKGPFERARLMPPIELDGETRIEAKLAYQYDDASWFVEFARPKVAVRKKISWQLDPQSCEFDSFAVAVNQRVVWEPGEPVVLMARRQIDRETKQQGDVVALWIEQLGNEPLAP